MYNATPHVQVSRGLLPDVGSPYEGEGGTVTDALDFLLLNFTEMNKLWVRMQVRVSVGVSADMHNEKFFMHVNMHNAAASTRLHPHTATYTLIH